MGIFLNPDDTIPALSPGSTISYQLVGEPPEHDSAGQVRVGEGFLHGCRTLQRRPLSDSVAEPIRTLLATVETYGDRGMAARCFFPGFAFTFGQDQDAVDVLVCLECRWVYFYSRGMLAVTVVPTDRGLLQLEAVYHDLFGDRSASDS
jgi:hypothetical protein